MTKPLILLSSLMLFVLSASWATGATPQEPGAKASGKLTADVLTKAKKLYEIDCAFCHNSNGDGKSSAATDMSLKLLDWTDPKSLAGKTDAELFDTIRKGKDKMPPEDPNRAKDDEVWGIIHHIRGMAVKDKPADTAAPAAAAAQSN
jgi:mono/diheme cytochrome c family protein